MVGLGKSSSIRPQQGRSRAALHAFQPGLGVNPDLHPKGNSTRKRENHAASHNQGIQG